MLKLLLIGVMGGIGSILRYGSGVIVSRFAGDAWPLRTLFVNVLGCLCAGIAAAVIASRPGVREEWRLAILVGLLGGFTTFSAFGLETYELFRDGRNLAAAMNVLLNVTLGLLAVWIGAQAYRALSH